MALRAEKGGTLGLIFVYSIEATYPPLDCYAAADPLKCQGRFPPFPKRSAPDCGTRID